jgi:murein tripeptide amidase MpaA
VSAFAIGLLFVAFSPVAMAGITFSQEFDSGSLDVANTTVNGNQVQLVGRKTWTKTGYPINYADHYRWFYFNAAGVNGQQVDFSMNSTKFLGDLSDHVFVYSYDQVNWHYFDNAGIVGNTYSFSNNTPFTQDSVYVAYSLPYPVSRMTNYVDSIKSNPYVSPTPSASADLIIGQSAGGVDDCGRTVDPQDLYAFKITNPAATGDKTKVVLVGGNHACETLGSFGLEGMLDFLLSGAPAAEELLASAEFYVYPMVNMDGRYAGYYRSTPENSTEDTNRHWGNTTGFNMTQLETIYQAILADLPFDEFLYTGGTDYFLDFHGYFGPWSDPDYYHIINDDPEKTFQNNMAVLLPGIQEKELEIVHGGMAHKWATRDTTLNASCSVVAEFGAHPGTTEADLKEIGALYGLALHHTILEVPEPTTCLSLSILLLLMLFQVARRKIFK